MSETRASLSELRRALAHLDDPLYLESLGLAKQISDAAKPADLSKGQTLRRALHLAIASLDPGADREPGGVEARPYQVLYRYAISKQSMVAIARQLDISERQAYRELGRATEALAQILDDLGLSSKPMVDAGQGASQRATRVREEMGRLASSHEQDVDLASLLAGAIETASALAKERDVRIKLVDESDRAPHVAINRVLLRQVVLNLLSHMASVHQGDEIVVRLQRSTREACVQLVYSPSASPEAIAEEDPYAVARQLLKALGLRWQRIAENEGGVQIQLCIPLSQPHTVLIVDDNEGVIALFRRYLRNQPYQVYGARNLPEALSLAQDLRPEVVVLDVMLPDQDGWEVLRALRAQQGEMDMRVIICSIINDPKLALALGADAFLHKPVDRARLLQAISFVLAPSA